MSEFLSPRGLAEYLGIPVDTVYRWRTRHVGPPAARIGIHTRYRKTDVDKWIESRKEVRA